MRLPFKMAPTPSGAPTVSPAVGDVASLIDSFKTIYEVNQRLLEWVTTLSAERDAARDVCEYYAQQVADFKQALELCMRNDGTARYENNEPRCRDGHRPRPGSRWTTPHKIAKAVLS